MHMDNFLDPYEYELPVHIQAVNTGNLLNSHFECYVHSYVVVFKVLKGAVLMHECKLASKI